MINRIYAEAQRISKAGLGTISLGISTYQEYDLLSCTYYPAGWHEAQRSVNSGKATPEQLKVSQSNVALSNTCVVDDEILTELLEKLEAIQ